MDPSDYSTDKKIGTSVYVAGTGIVIIICLIIFVQDDFIGEVGVKLGLIIIGGDNLGTRRIHKRKIISFSRMHRVNVGWPNSFYC